MKFINPSRSTPEKTRIDTVCDNNRPWGVGFARTYLNKPAKMVFDCFGKTSGSTFGTSTKVMQQFYSKLQWIGIEYISASKAIAWNWAGFMYLINEYMERITESELSQPQYDSISALDEDFDKCNVVHDYVSVGVNTQYLHSHPYGFSPIYGSRVVETGGNYTVNDAKDTADHPTYGIAVRSGGGEASAIAGLSTVAAVCMGNRQMYSVESTGTVELPISSLGRNAHSHLGYITAIKEDTGRTFEGVLSDSSTSDQVLMMARSIRGAKLQNSSIKYIKGSTSQRFDPHILCYQENGFDNLDQNSIMHDLPCATSSIVSAYTAYRSLYGYSAPFTTHHLNVQLEARQRYSLTVLTEPYQTMAPLDDGNMASYEFVGSDGGVGSPAFLNISGNLSTIQSIDMELLKTSYNNDVIHTITVSGGYLGGSGVNQLASPDDRCDAGVYDYIQSAKHSCMVLDANFLGSNIYDAIKYQYPGGKIVVVGAGIMRTLNALGTGYDISVKLYCSGLDTADASANYSETVLVRDSGHAAGVDVIVSRHEALGPVVRFPGMRGYVRITRKLSRIKPATHSSQSAAVYEVEVPFCRFGKSMMSGSVRGFVMVQSGYLKAGSCERYVSYDSNAVPVSDLNDLMWIGVSDRSPISALALTGPTALYATNHSDTGNICDYYSRSHLYNPYIAISGGDDSTSIQVSNINSIRVIKRLCKITNKYWSVGSGRMIGYFGNEHPAYRANIDISSLYNQNKASGLDIMSRWFLAKAVGGGGMQDNVGDALQFIHKPNVKNDSGIWAATTDSSGSEYWNQLCVGSRETSICNMLMANMQCVSVVTNYDPATDGTGSSTKMVQATLIPMYGTTLPPLCDEATITERLYNSNLQCLYFTKVDGIEGLSCRTMTYKVLHAHRNGSDQEIQVTIYIGDEKPSDVEDSLLASKFDLGACSIGNINILEPQSNAGAGPGSIIQSSRIMHTFSLVPNTYKGFVAYYLGVFLDNATADMFRAADLSTEHVYYIYYNILENAFMVFNSQSWEMFYRVDDWVGIKPDFVDAYTNLNGYVSGNVISLLFGQRPARYPLPEHIGYYTSPPAVRSFINTIKTKCYPIDFGMKYIGFTTDAGV